MVMMQFLRNTIEPMLPNFLVERTFFQLELWQWLVLAVVGIAAYFLSYTFARITLFFARRDLVRQIPDFDRQSIRLTFKPVRLIYLVIIVAMVVPFLDLAKTPWLIVVTALKIIVVLSLTWLAFRALDVLMTLLRHRLEEKGRASIIVTLPLLRRSVKIAVGVLCGLAVLQNLHIEVTALIAGLSVGGVAVALASQKTLENLFGGLMIILDQPIRVGEECKFNNQQGIVEGIGLRSTRIRTPERSLIAIPNSDLSQMHLENLSERDRIRFTTTFGLRYETSPEQLRNVLIEVRQILYSHPKIDRDPARVRLINFGTNALEIEIVAYVLTSSNTEHLAVKEDILLRIMEAVYGSGTAFALPSLVSYTGAHEFLDKRKKTQAEERVASLRSNRQMPLPEFSDEQIANIDDTIDYPPRGSANDDPKTRYFK
jgi:MscS family membrane protein